MLDLGTSFLASVERNPSALAIVDGAVRLTYAEWYRGISSVLAGLDALGLKRDDHLLTVVQNRWEAATVHWACQFAGVIVTPVNWRATANELEFLIENSEAKALVYEDVTAEAVAQSKAAQALPRVALGEPKSGEIGWIALAGRDAPDAAPRVRPEAWSVMLYTSGTTARPKGVPRRQSAERAAALAHVAQNMYGNGERTLGVMPLYHTMGVRSLLAMSLIGGLFVCMPRFDVVRALELIASEKITNLYLVPTLYHDLVHHPRFVEHECEFRPQARLCRRADDRWPTQRIASSVQAGAIRQPLRFLGNLHLYDRSKRAGEARLGRQSRHQPARARYKARRCITGQSRDDRGGRRDHRVSRWR